MALRFSPRFVEVATNAAYLAAAWGVYPRYPTLAYSLAGVFVASSFFHLHRSSKVPDAKAIQLWRALDRLSVLGSILAALYDVGVLPLWAVLLGAVGAFRAAFGFRRLDEMVALGLGLVMGSKPSYWLMAPLATLFIASWAASHAEILRRARSKKYGYVHGLWHVLTALAIYVWAMLP